MRRFVCLIILVKLLGVLDVYSQKKESNFQLMADSCYVCLEKQDSVSFINSLSQLYEAYLKENDTYYQISQKLERILLEDQSIRLLYLDARKNKVEFVASTSVLTFSFLPSLARAVVVIPVAFLKSVLFIFLSIRSFQSFL